MIEVAALMLCKIGGQSGSADEIKAVLEAAGLEPNEEHISKLVGDVEGKEINALLAEGMEKVKDIPLGGGGGGSGGGAGAGPGADAGGAAAAPAEEEKEEEEMDLGGGMDMFGGDEGGEGGKDY
jgi:ribosomal protein L12E/L44/L45/RPP1/RPP2